MTAHTKCPCGDYATVRWTQPSAANVPDPVHELCDNCMAKIWEEICTKYPESETHGASCFEPLMEIT